MKIEELTDCVKLSSGDKWANVYPDIDDLDKTPLPEEFSDELESLSDDEEQAFLAALERVRQRNAVLREQSDAENAVFVAEVAKIQEAEQLREDARAEATMIKRGRLPLPADYREDAYLWEALARMGVVKSEAEEKAGD